MAVRRRSRGSLSSSRCATSASSLVAARWRYAPAAWTARSGAQSSRRARRGRNPISLAIRRACGPKARSPGASSWCFVVASAHRVLPLIPRIGRTSSDIAYGSSSTASGVAGRTQNSHYRSELRAMMKILTAKDGRGRLIDVARCEPIAAAKHGRRAVVVVAAEESKRLKRADGVSDARRPRLSSGNAQGGRPHRWTPRLKPRLKS
jgi:hypothetical protein